LRQLFSLPVYLLFICDLVQELCDASLPALIAFSMGAQLLAVAVLCLVGRQRGA
jgi:hypothetical protein